MLLRVCGENLFGRELTPVLRVIRRDMLLRVVGCGIVLLAARGLPAAAGWYTDYEAAVTRARQDHKPLVVLFEHEGCPDCERMNRSLAARASRAALECAVKVRLEFSNNGPVVNRFGISLTPTFLVLRPDGRHMNEVYREVGSMSVERLVQVGSSIRSLAAQLEQQADPSSRRSGKEEEKATAASSSTKKKSSSRSRASSRRRAAPREDSSSRPASYPQYSQQQQQYYYQYESPRYWPW